MKVSSTYLVAAAATMVALVASHPAAVQAQQPDGRPDDEAQRLFLAGQEAYAEGRYRAAADLFERCHGLTGAPELLYNAGRSAERSGDPERAIALYRRFIASDPPAADRVAAEDRVRELQARTRVEPPSPQGGRGGIVVVEPPAGQADRSDGVLQQWWFWTLAGILVTGVVVGTLLLTRDPGTEDPLPGDVGPGGVIAALWVGRLP